MRLGMRQKILSLLLAAALIGAAAGVSPAQSGKGKAPRRAYACKTNYVARTRAGYYAPKGGAATATPKF